MNTKPITPLVAVAPATTCSPCRVWRRRVKGWRMPENTVSVCRPRKWGNPFGLDQFRWTRPDPESDMEPRRRSDEECQFEAVAIYENWLPAEKIEEARRELRGKNLACFCKPGTPCHADVLLGLANVEVHTSATGSEVSVSNGNDLGDSEQRDRSGENEQQTMDKNETHSKRGNVRKQQAGGDCSSATCPPSYEGLVVFQIHSIRWDDDDHTTGKDWTTTIVCKDIKAAWEWLGSELEDMRVEVRTIHHMGHACAVIPFIPENH